MLQSTIPPDFRRIGKLLHRTATPLREYWITALLVIGALVTIVTLALPGVAGAATYSTPYGYASGNCGFSGSARVDPSTNWVTISAHSQCPLHDQRYLCVVANNGREPIHDRCAKRGYTTGSLYFPCTAGTTYALTAYMVSGGSTFRVSTSFPCGGGGGGGGSW